MGEVRFIVAPRALKQIEFQGRRRALALLSDGAVFTARKEDIFRAPLIAAPTRPADAEPAGTARENDCEIPSFNGRWVFIAEPSGRFSIIDTSLGGRRILSGTFEGKPRPTFVQNDVLMLLDDTQLRRIDCIKGTFKTRQAPQGVSELTMGGDWTACTSDTFHEIRAVSQRGQTRTFDKAATFRQMSLSPDGRWLLIQSAERFCLYSTETGAVQFDHDLKDDVESDVKLIRWSSDGRRGALGTALSIYVWSMQARPWLVRFPRYAIYPEGEFALSPDGRSLATTASPTSSIWIWPDLDAVVSEAANAAP